MPLPPPLPPFRVTDPPPAPDGPLAVQRRDTISAVTWMAAIGALLVLAAASVLVVGNWNHIDPRIKLVGLVAANGLIAAVAAAMRKVSPVVSRALDHLAAMLAVPSGVAVMAAAHEHWPIAITAGGVAGVIGCAAQAKRLRAPLLGLAAEGASVVALAGIATMAHAPLGVLVAAVALVAMLVRRDATAARLASVASMVPMLAVLGAFDVGSGTTVRMGARGAVLGWAAPTAGVLAALVLLVVAHRRSLAPLAVAGVAALVSGVVTALDVLHAANELWAAVPALFALGVLVADEWARRSGSSNAMWSSLGSATSRVVEVGLLADSPIAALILLDRLFSREPSHALAYALAAWVAAGAAASVRRARLAVLAPWLRLATVVAAAAAVQLWSAQPVSVAIVGLLAAGVATLVATRVNNRDRNRVGLYLLAPGYAVERIGAAILALVGAAATAAHGDDRTAIVALVVAVAACVFGASALADRRSRRDRLGIVALSSAAGAVMWIGWPSAIWSASAALLAVVVIVLGGGLVDLAAALTPLAVATGLHAGGTSVPVATLCLLTLAVALTGGSMTFTRWTPIGTAAAASGVTCALVALHGDHAGLATVAVALIGAQGHLYGRLHRQRDLANVGALVFVASVLALPWTTGVAPALQHRLAAHGITGTDLAVSALTIGLFVGGALLRSKQRDVSSWVAYGPGLVLAGLYLMSTQEATHQQSRIGVAIGLGVVAIAVGGVRRLAAPLLLGTALVAAATVLATGHQLASLPVWTWLAVGGVVLLSVALLVERRQRDDEAPVAGDSADRHDDAKGERLIDTIRRSFS